MEVAEEVVANVDMLGACADLFVADEEDGTSVVFIDDSGSAVFVKFREEGCLKNRFLGTSGECNVFRFGRGEGNGGLSFR